MPHADGFTGKQKLAAAHAIAPQAQKPRNVLTGFAE
jgi:hypothetical protein